MGLYGFKPQFWRYVLDGSKMHTIRCPRKYPDHHGCRMHMVGNARQPNCFLLMEAFFQYGEQIILERNDIELSGVRLSADERDRLAWSDGFRAAGTTLDNPGPSFRDMSAFWRASQLPFVGVLNRWSYPALAFGDPAILRERLLAQAWDGLVPREAYIEDVDFLCSEIHEWEVEFAMDAIGTLGWYANEETLRAATHQQLREIDRYSRDVVWRASHPRAKVPRTPKGWDKFLDVCPDCGSPSFDGCACG